MEFLRRKGLIFVVAVVPSFVCKNAHTDVRIYRGNCVVIVKRYVGAEEYEEKKLTKEVTR